MRQFLRKARTCGEACEPPPDPAADDAAAAEGGEDGEGGEEGAEGEDIPDWCNPATEMGAWLNYATIRTICSERGATDFGPYGGQLVHFFLCLEFQPRLFTLFVYMFQVSLQRKKAKAKKVAKRTLPLRKKPQQKRPDVAEI